MKDLLKKEEKQHVNPVVAAVAGVAVGVGAAVATSNYLKDKKTKKMVDGFVEDFKDRALDVKDKAVGYFEDNKDQPEVKEAKKIVKKVKKTAKKV